MAKDERGKRDGTGPFKGSFQFMNKLTGRRQARGEKCPAPKKK